MKVVISLPDPLFAAAEQLAEHLHLSRSQLYAQALSAYLGTRQAELVTQQLNAIYGAQCAGVEAPVMSTQLQSISHETW